MAPKGPLAQLVFGRDPSCDVVIDHATVSSRHARLVVGKGVLVLEDLGSTNGTFVAGERITQAQVARGADVRFGDVALAWGDPRVVAAVRKAGRAGTLVMSSRPSSAGGVGGAARTLLGLVAGAAVGGVLLVGGYVLMNRYLATHGGSAPSAPLIPGVVVPEVLAADTPLGPERARSIGAAIDPTSPVTRNTAVKIAAGEEGPFHVEQIARLWTHVRGRWQYVNDPQGNEYFAKASETIGNDYAGDCDDFAIVLASMVEAIGGKARVVVMNSPEGGHAYAEACVQMPPAELATRLQTYYRRKWDPYLGRQRVTAVRYRSAADCPVWLNLDWSAGVPGGPYTNETWAVAVKPDGTAENVPPGRAESGPDAGTPRSPR